MKRRNYLLACVTGSMVGVAGCAGSSETDGDDTTPIDRPPEELVLTIDDFDGTGWSTGGSEVDGNMAEASFINLDDDEDIISQVWVYDTVEEAEDEYQARYDDISASRSTEESDIGSEGFAYQKGPTMLMFRDANVIGQIQNYGQNHEGSVSTASDYAALMHGKWR